MTWHLMTSDPHKEKIPSSHRYREISHEEFRAYARYLEIYQLQGEIVTNHHLGDVIIGRILRSTDIPVRRTNLCSSKYDFNGIRQQLQAQDFVLVCHPKVYGFYINIAYARAEDSKFKQMVETGIFEPKDTDFTSPVRIRSIAQEVSALNKRIAEVRRFLLQETTAEGQKDTDATPEITGDYQQEQLLLLQELLKEYEQQKNHLLQDPALSDTSQLEKILQEYSDIKVSIRTQKDELLLRQRIEAKVNDKPDRYKELCKNIDILNIRIANCTSALKYLQELRKELYEKQ